MERAGESVARLALATEPHARKIWIACGSGNNGGDGLEAALKLKVWGKSPTVTWLGRAHDAPADVLASLRRAQDAGVEITDTPPENQDLSIDALLGIGARLHPIGGPLAHQMRTLNASGAPILSIDLPSGLDADTGQASDNCVRARHTLNLLTLKPGLYTASGRDACGTIWLDTLGVMPFTAHATLKCRPIAWLTGQPPSRVRLHSSHKGSYGDVAVIGGCSGMVGAALLAGTAALNAGAGRVYVCLLSDDAAAASHLQPALMFRTLQGLDLADKIVVAGCGGGRKIARVLPSLLSQHSARVFDADAINAIGADTRLSKLLEQRGQSGLPTVLTPHPLEAARLLNTSVESIQADRLSAACVIAERFGCVAVLKGSGTIIASPGDLPFICPTGNARLATAGTGDVLAGFIAARIAAGESSLEAARNAAFLHGLAADEWSNPEALTAANLATCARISASAS